jgi:hypothetical protein
MLINLLSTWCLQATNWILSLFVNVFPEYPQIGIGVAVVGAIFFIYYLMQGMPLSAVKTTSTTLGTLTLLLYTTHSFIKFLHVAF